ncbi:U1 small nuclear ribonucleoprotein C isoform X2 [Drosophila eugracilis]|uniref:U1 small nuclear ribonucleoprotein C isoform X2 n=1 Tax=Drosophila eugracilis TaxID=29029 RepID=UPI0007E80EA4|nr:U1 small nuclear ribonucleoprotein C isoform X2 [Drosophila eugracilis]
MHREHLGFGSIKRECSCSGQVIPRVIMDRRVTATCLVILQLLASGFCFQDKAPVQTSLIAGQARNAKQEQMLDDPVGSGRGIDEHLLKTIEDQQHPRQYGYGPPPPWSPAPPPVYPPPPQRPWAPPPPPGGQPYYNPYYNGFNYYGGYGGYGYGAYGYPGYGGYPGYPYYPYYRSSAGGEVDNQLPGPDGLTPPAIPGVFQGRAVLSQNFLEGRNNANIVPLYHLLQMARA